MAERPEAERLTTLAIEASVPSTGPVAFPDDGQEEGPKDGEDPEAKDSKESDKSPEELLDDAIEARIKADQEVTYKEAELEIARFARAAEEIEIVESLREKREALRVAREELARFEEREKPLEIREAELELERSRDRVLKAETDLANMREIMGEEAEAKNKEEIIRRYEKTLEFAVEGLAIETEQRALKVDLEMPAKVLELAGAVRTAEAELQADELHAEKKRRSSELDGLKASHELDEAKRDQKKAKKEVADLRKKEATGKDVEVEEGDDK